MSTIAYPQIRANIEAAIEGLADTELQERAWIGHNARPTGECATFDDAVHWLFYDSGLDDGKPTRIGYTLYDEQEAQSVSAIMKHIERLLLKYGNNVPDAIHIRSPEWPLIVSIAKDCLQLFKGNDSKNMTLPTGTGGRET